MVQTVACNVADLILNQYAKCLRSFGGLRLLLCFLFSPLRSPPSSKPCQELPRLSEQIYQVANIFLVGARFPEVAGGQELDARSLTSNLVTSDHGSLLL